MTRRPDLLVSATWLLLTLWVAVGSVGIVIGIAWLIAQSVDALVGFAMWVGGV